MPTFIVISLLTVVHSFYRFAFLEFKSVEEATLAAKKMKESKKKIDNRIIRIRFADSQGYHGKLVPSKLSKFFCVATHLVIVNFIAFWIKV